jgi:hypothetical protein
MVQKGFFGGATNGFFSMSQFSTEGGSPSKGSETEAFYVSPAVSGLLTRPQRCGLVRLVTEKSDG